MQKWPIEEMLPPLLDAAVHWMSIGLPLARLKLVTQSSEQAARLAKLFAAEKGKYGDLAVSPTQHGFRFDVFVSYSRKDLDKAALLVEELKRLRPRLRVFFDQLELNPGAAWQQEIYEALDACRRFVPLFSPAYLDSKVCKEEFNIACYRQRELEEPVIFPIYLYSAPLPTYMRLVNYIDCREGDEEKLRLACEVFFSHLD